ncbi:MAG: phosphoenolpyruvate--protein phosphotransferase [Coxiellaceae bacterium]|nr:phosphoenolpyruvate--protein phosphotransferase [Coxiellaceae bacterium]|tara:strand:+ start:6833 stop:9094 length:2262 start_codon:yes stop_codon:yes gene_type:complete
MLLRLQRLLQDLLMAHQPESVLQDVIAEVTDQIQADVSALYLVNIETGDYDLNAHHGLYHSHPEVGCHFKRHEGLIGLVGEREEPVNLDNMTLHDCYVSDHQFNDEKLTAFLGMPIFSQGELVAVWVAANRNNKAFNEDQEALLVTVCAQLGQALQRFRIQFYSVNLSGRKKQFVLEGISGGFGVAVGQVVVIYPPADLEAVPDKQINDIDAEIDLFESALTQTREEMRVLQVNAKSQLSDTDSVLFDVYLRMLDSRSLMNEVIEEIKTGAWAQAALKRVIHHHVAHFESLEDHYLRERAADFRDLGRRILSHLQKNLPEQKKFKKNTILVSEEVSATALVEVPEGCLSAIISGKGSGNSHVAILARSLGLPSVMSVSGIHLDQLAGKEVIVDGFNGQVYVDPTAEMKRDFRRLVREEKDFDSQLESLWDQPGVTLDGHQIGLYVNTGLAVDGGTTLKSGAEGIGLYRTELPFMLRDRFPSEEEQRVMYRQLLTAFSPRSVTMRTLDIGGDKVLRYFPFSEENPFLGWRGIRISLDHPDIFLQQLRAMMQASEGLNNLSIMLPMITSLQEVEAAKMFIDQAFREVKDEGLKIKMPKLGLMIEVPAAVYQVTDLAKCVDFISVGSNDLIQYLLAVDRNNPRVAQRYNSLHPAVLGSLDAIVKGAHKANRPVSICGEMASDPLTVLLLVGMGFDILSLNARNLARTKWMIRHFHYEEAKSLVKTVLQMNDATEIRLHMETVLDDADMGALIRAGY